MSAAERTAVAVVAVRDGVLPAGADQAVAEAGGSVVIIGDNAGVAAEGLLGVATSVRLIEVGPFAAGAYADALAAVVDGVSVIVVPASADGRDLAPRLAAALERPLYANAVKVRPDVVSLARHGGTVLAEQVIAGPCVITLQPGVRTVQLDDELDAAIETVDAVGASATNDAAVISVLAPDVTTMDLSEAPRILGGGAGLQSAERFTQLADIAAQLGASMGATRVITDRAWLGHSRQIGTTGVVVDPDLYLAFGISGAVQHTAGLGDPEHIISINVDPHCPMMEMADLAIVADANETLDELQAQLARNIGVVNDNPCRSGPSESGEADSGAADSEEADS